MGLYAVSGGVYTVKGAAEFISLAKGLEECKCGISYVWCHTTKSVQPGSSVLRNSNSSTVTNLECHVSFRHCWLSLLLSLSLSCHSKTSRQRKWDGEMREMISVRRRDSERKAEESDRLIVCLSRVSLSTPSRVLLACPPVTPLNKCQSLITISKVAETLKTIIMSVFPVALEKSLERSGGNSPSTLPSLLVQERKAQLGPTISTQLCCMHCDWSDATHLHNYHKPWGFLLLITISVFLLFSVSYLSSALPLKTSTHGYIRALTVILCRVRYIGLPFYLADTGLLLNIRYQPVSVLYHKNDGCYSPATAAV